MRARIVAAVAVVALAALGGCSDSPKQSGSSEPGKGAESVENPSDGAEKEKQAPNRGAATNRDSFLPLLVDANSKVTWPPAYTMSPEDVWKFMEAGAKDTRYLPEDAVSTVGIWNVCAWTLQLIDDVKAQRSVDKAVSVLTSVSDPGLAPMLTRIVADAKLGEISMASQFVTANDCAKGFPK